MKLKVNNLSEEEFIGFWGKYVAILFMDGETLTGFIDGFTWAADNEPEIASLSFKTEDRTIEVYQNEISVIKEIK